MNRRQLLASLAASALLAPFAGANPHGLSDVSAAFRKAAEGSGQLLVFVVPEADDEKWRRGEALGEFLNHGDPKVLARLDGIPWVAASMRDLRAVVPSAPDHEPLMVLVDATAIPATTTAMNTALPDTPDRWAEDSLDTTESVITRRITAIEGLITAALPPAPDPDAAHARVALRVRTRIEGSHWQKRTGCGNYFEGAERQLMARCGMGHVTRRSARVLYFFPVDA